MSEPSRYAMPFYYPTLDLCWVIWRVDTSVVAPFLKGTGLVPVAFGDTALISLHHHAHGGPAGGSIETVELSILAHPADAAQPAADSLDSFLLGESVLARAGNFRLHVASSSLHAVNAGRDLYGERKFLAICPSEVPSLNIPDRLSWRFGVQDPDVSSRTIFTLEVGLSNLVRQRADRSRILQYGELGDRLIGSVWTIFGPQDSFRVAERPDAVRLSLGDSDHPLRDDIDRLIGKAAPYVVQMYQSPPVATQGAAFDLGPLGNL